ncbi:MAG: AIR synthase family protein [Candidatus Wukongarchaeota archaeon]|nr:AIR synthase family protein [Candidatus Wukongarchaeota archaeon]MDO8129183.1 AIR synthase family protein [Candidatus Wukongarchaeota archaeon]
MGKELPKVGKLAPAVFEEVIFPFCGAEDENVLVPPRHGVDAGVIDLGDGRIMVVAEDPTFGVPSWGWKQFGWGIVHICAGDVACLGIKPKYMTICLLLPPGTERETLEEIWQTIHTECVKLGITIIGGHTGVYPGIAYPLNGGCTVIGIGEKARYVTPEGARSGDKVIITKGAAIEAAGILALQYPKTLGAKYGKDFVKRAQDLYWQMSVIKDALTAVEVGGVTAMHDATEGGIWGGLYEVVNASDVGIRIEKEKIILLDEAKKVCEFFEIDPYESISEGTLIITVKPEKVEKVLEVLEKEDISATIAGDILPKNEGRIVVKSDGSETKLKFPEIDPFWGAFFKTLEEPEE